MAHVLDLNKVDKIHHAFVVANILISLCFLRDESVLVERREMMF
jgi:hypothetical protein